MLAKKFTEANEDKADAAEAGAGKSRQSGYRSKLEGRISEEIEDDEVQMIRDDTVMRHCLWSSPACPHNNMPVELSFYTESSVLSRSQVQL